MEYITLDVLTTEMTRIFILSIAAFLLGMLLTPVYTFLAYRYKFWKKQRSTSGWQAAYGVYWPARRKV